MIDLSKVPGVVEIENTSNEDIKIMSQPGSTQGFILPAGETVMLRAETSADLVAYLAQESVSGGKLRVTPPTEIIGSKE